MGWAGVSSNPPPVIDATFPQVRGFGRCSQGEHGARHPAMGPIATIMHAKLTAGLEPSSLVIEDDSARHAGHAGMAVHAAKQGGGATGSGETHFNIQIVATVFEGKSRVARQRLVFDLLRDELAGPVHALSLKTSAPGEAG
ncbi:MAG: BolA family transcriptional regulator [Hyphomonadaceae bacterium]|jgi:BolA protein|nr:BolA family transcriptional regulator [Hyphomonadaceae bacterium]